MDDRQIIELFFVRSDQAIPELERAHGAAVRRVADNIVSDARDAEECVSDTWLRTWNSIPPKRPDPLRTYVCRIARNLAISRFRAEHAQKRNSAYDTVLDELEGVLPAPQDPASEYEAKELARSISAFLDGVSEEDRFFFMRRYWYGDAVAEIASMRRCGDHRVSVRLFRIREKLKEHLKKEGYLP